MHQQIDEPRLADSVGADGASNGSRPFAIELDASARIVRARAWGNWEKSEADAYLAELERQVGTCRLRFGGARVLIDRRDVVFQSPEVMARLAAANGSVFGAGDHVALVVRTNLDKSGLRQRMPHAATKAFLSIDAAEKWLSAFG